MSLYSELENIPRNDWPQYLKKNYPEVYLEFAWQKSQEWRNNQKDQATILGDTPDYSRQLFTLDERANRMVYRAFKQYWKDGLIYKNAYLVNWSIGLQTALSDVAGEIEYEKRVDPFVTFEYRYTGFLYSQGLDKADETLKKLIYKTTDFFEKNPIKVSTVRPETIFGDVAVAIHPDVLEKKFCGFSVQEIQTIMELIKNADLDIYFQVHPLQNTGVKLILATEVDPNFGTGALKITPASDITDYKLWQKYLIGDFPSAIGRDGKLTQECGDFAGKKVEEGRMLIIKKLLETGFISKKTTDQTKNETEIEKLSQLEFEKLDYQKQQEYLKKLYPNHEIDWNYEHNVSICERSKTVIEPLISEEFFLNYHKVAKSTNKSLKQLGLEGVEEIQFFSSDYQDRAKNFINNINDWCISRDLVWGHQIPVWYNLDINPEKKLYSFDELKNIKEILPIHIGDQKPNLPGNWVKETKIFDTWFSSSLWPLTTLDFYDYLEQTEDLIMIHGGDSFEKYEDYLEFIKNWELSPSDYLDINQGGGNWKKDLQKELPNYNIQVSYPQFPNKLNAKYEEWKIWFEKVLDGLEIAKINSDYSTVASKRRGAFYKPNLLGHSLGGNFLLKYLSENNCQVKNLYLVASCLSEGDFSTEENNFSRIEENCENIYIYHSTDDQIVDFQEAEILKQKLPKAKLVKFEDRGHFVQPVFSELKNQIIRDLTKNTTITDFERFYPTQEMTTAKEIFYLWIVRMIILGKYFTGKIPFENVIITPTVLDEKGRKMSKSLGNGLDPAEAINKFSSDSLRLAMLGGMIPNRNMKMGGALADTLMEKYRNMGNKIWNIARFLESKE